MSGPAIVTQILHNERKTVKQWDSYLGRSWSFQRIIVLLCFKSFNSTLNDSHKRQGGICETRKGPNRPRFEGILNISYMLMFLKITTWAFWPNSANFWWPNLTETVKRHIHTQSPFIWAYNQITMTFRSQVLPVQESDNRRTGGQSNSICLKLWGWGIKMDW